MEVRKGEEKDIDAVAALYEELTEYLESHINYPGWRRGIYPAREDAVQGISEGNLFVAEEGGRIVGTVILRHTPEEAYRSVDWHCDLDEDSVLVVYTFAVHPEFLHQGIGRKMMKFIIDYAECTHMKAVRLDVYEKNVPAIRLYEESEFQYIDTVDLGYGMYGLKWFRLYQRRFEPALKRDAVLETQRLYLREMDRNDFEALSRILQDEETMYAYNGAFNHEETQAWLDKQIARYRQYGFGLWAVILKETDEMIGQCGLTMQPWKDREVLEIGYLLRRDCWHKGYATEAAEACKEYAFTKLHAEEICSIIRDINLPSQRVALRNGMTVEDCWVKHYRGVDMPHNRYVVRRMEKGSICRKGGLKDCKEIYDLICEMESRQLPFDRFAEIYQAQLCDRHYDCLVYELDKKIIGVLNLRFEEQLHHAERIAEIMEFAVLSSCRKKGIGKELFMNACQLAKESGCSQIEVACNQLRTDAHRFYIREGMHNFHFKFSKSLMGNDGSENSIGR